MVLSHTGYAEGFVVVAQDIGSPAWKKGALLCRFALPNGPTTVQPAWVGECEDLAKANGVDIGIGRECLPVVLKAMAKAGGCSGTLKTIEVTVTSLKNLPLHKVEASICSNTSEINRATVFQGCSAIFKTFPKEYSGKAPGPKAEEAAETKRSGAIAFGAGAVSLGIAYLSKSSSARFIFGLGGAVGIIGGAFVYLTGFARERLAMVEDVSKPHPPSEPGGTATNTGSGIAAEPNSKTIRSVRAAGIYLGLELRNQPWNEVGLRWYLNSDYMLLFRSQRVYFSSQEESESATDFYRNYNESLTTLSLAKFWGTNSFYSSAGLGYRRFFSSVSGRDLYSRTYYDQYDRRDIGLDLAVGNVWEYGVLTFGIEWLAVYFPVETLSEDQDEPTPDGTEGYALARRNRHISDQGTRLINLSAGISF